MTAAALTRRRLRAWIGLAVAGSMLAFGLAGARAAVPALAPAGAGIRAVCPPAASGRLRCHVLELTAPARAAGRTGPAGRPAAAAGAAQTTECHVPAEGCYGLRPADLHTAYELPQAPPSPQTIAIIAAGGDPTIRKDLANYDSIFALPGCPGESPCPAVVNGAGEKRPLPAVQEEAPLETSLDVEVAHAVCPGCDLLLVEAASETLAAFEEATDTAVRLGADEISISFGEAEPASVVEGGAAFDHPGVVITAPAGDTGYLNWSSPEAERGRPEYPASSPYVIAVGGTTLELGPAGEWQGEQVWDRLEPKDEGTGSGCSTLFAAPAWQLELPKWEALGCGGARATDDLAAIADPHLGVAAYDTTKNSEGHKPGWKRVGGTSVGAPLVAAAFALAGGAHGVPYPAKTLYRNAALDPGLLNEIATGTNGACGRTLGRGCTPGEQAADCADRPICVAGPGYDGPTGLGSLHGIGALEPPLAFRTVAPSQARRGDSFGVEAVVEFSGEPVPVASATPDVCAVTEGEVTLLAAGTCTLAAARPGYREAQQSFAVAGTPQQVGFSSDPPADAVAGGPSYTPAASATSGLPVTIVSLTPEVCGLQGNSVAPIAAGLCTIAAEQAGDGEYEAAQPAMQSYPVAARAAAGVLSLRETPTPFAGSASLRLHRAPSISRRDGAITLSLALSPGGKVRWLMTFGLAGKCRPHAACARRIVTFASGSRTVAAGGLKLILRPRPAALRVLHERRPLRVHALLTLTTSSGTVRVLRSTIVVRLSG
ncbi:MAG: S8 family serine peptidase [Solirubrobacteraceae bacterium]